MCAAPVCVVMNAHLFIIYRPDREGGREGWMEGTGSVPAPASAAVHRIDVLSDSAADR